MKRSLPPVPHSKTHPKLAHRSLHLASLSLAFAGLFFTLASALAIAHAPYISWIPDQRLTSSTPGFQTQYFRIINFDGGGLTFQKMSTNPGWYAAGNNNITIAQCTGEAGCASDNTGWKIMFAHTPTTDNRTTISIKAIGSTGAIGYTSFTLQLDTSGHKGPPSIASLPNRASQMNSAKQVTYVAQFAIEDRDESGSEDLDEITALDNFHLDSNNPSLFDPSLAGSYSLTAVLPDQVSGGDESTSSRETDFGEAAGARSGAAVEHSGTLPGVIIHPLDLQTDN